MIGDASVVNCLQTFDKNLFGKGYIAECNRTFLEETISYLTINQLVHQVADAFLGIFMH